MQDKKQYKQNPMETGFAMLVKMRQDFMAQIKDIKDELRGEIKDSFKEEARKELAEMIVDGAREKLSPVAGVDYYTEKEKAEFAKKILSYVGQIKEEQIKELAKGVARAIPIPKNGIDGKDVDETKIITSVLSKINIPKSLSPKEVISAIEMEVGKIKTLTEEDVKKLIPKLQKVFDPKERADEIARALETLKGVGKLDYFALKNLPDIPKEGGEKKVLHRGGQGLSVFASDISASCDGSNKTFTVPAHTRAIMLSGTDFPIIYKPTTDFTTSGTTLTLTSAVAAPISGATLIFVYAK